VCGAALAFARPQYSYPPPEGGTQSSGGQIVCTRVDTGPGTYAFTCNSASGPPKISHEHILWLKGPAASNQQLDVVIPNYKVEELIRAALKAGSSGSTSVNILLKKPETLYDVQVQEGGGGVQSKPSVNLQYEAVDRPTSVHYPTDKQYNPLAGPIREPGASGGPAAYY